MFKILVRDEEEDRVLLYDPSNGSLTRESGEQVLFSPNHRRFAEVPSLSPTNPIGKSLRLKVLKIHVGGPNSCSRGHCSQPCDNSLSEPKKFHSSVLSKFLIPPVSVELTGGDPFLQWGRVKPILISIRNAWPKVMISLGTNGLGANRGILEDLEILGVRTTIHHDGPGQVFRGADFLETHGYAHLKAAISSRPDHFTISSVLTRYSYDISKIRAFFVQIFGGEIKTKIEGVSEAYDSVSLTKGAGFTKQQLDLLSESVFQSLKYPTPLLLISGAEEKIADFIRSIVYKRPLTSLWQKCEMDRPDHMTIDLDGNAVMCQNFCDSYANKIGNLDDPTSIKLDKGRHFLSREECRSCPVVQICRGSCMRLEGELFWQSCHNSFAYSLSLMSVALYRVLGSVIVSIEGDIKRPPFPTI